MALENEKTINIVPSDGGVTFEFRNNKHYLTNGTITVPLNSLALITDESEMFTFRKANTNDIFLSGKYEDVGLSRAELQQLYEESFVGAGINMDDIDEEIDFMTADLVDNAVYDSASHSLVFYHGEDELFRIDAAPFIKDGMVSSVAVSGGNLVVTFNTDAGKQPISIPLTEIFDPSLYYTKSETDAAFSQAMGALNTFSAQTQAALATKADTSALTAHTGNTNVHFTGTQKSNYDGLEGQYYVDDSWDIMPQTAFNDFTNDYSTVMGQFDQRITANANALATKADTATTYTKNEVDNLLDYKADQADIDAQMEVIATSLNELKDDKLDVSAYTPTDLSNYYTKSETQAALAAKADTATTYTKTEVDNLLDEKLDATAYTPVDLSSYAKVDDVNDSLEVAARAMFQLKEEKLDVSAYTPVDTSSFATNASLTAHTSDSTIHVTQAEKTAWNGAVTQLGGISLVKLTQAEYDALTTKDANTLYIISGVA